MLKSPRERRRDVPGGHEQVQSDVLVPRRHVHGFQSGGVHGEGPMPRRGNVRHGQREVFQPERAGRDGLQRSGDRNDLSERHVHLPAQHERLQWGVRKQEYRSEQLRGLRCYLRSARRGRSADVRKRLVHLVMAAA